MIFFKFNNVGQLISTNKNASENQVSQGSVRANEIFVTFTGLLNNLSDTTNYSCYLTFIRNDGQSINDLRASATSYTFDGVTYYGYSYLINNKAITAVAGQLQISFRLIDLTVSTDNEVERTSAVESVSVVGTTILTSVSINLTQAQIQAIDQAIANAPATTYQTYVASDSEFETQINASETTGKENKIPTIGQVCNKFKNTVDSTTFNTALANKVDDATYNTAIGLKADLSYVNDEFAKYYKKEQVYSKSEIDAQHAELEELYQATLPDLSFEMGTINADGTNNNESPYNNNRCRTKEYIYLKKGQIIKFNHIYKYDYNIMEFDTNKNVISDDGWTSNAYWIAPQDMYVRIVLKKSDKYLNLINRATCYWHRNDIYEEKENRIIFDLKDVKPGDTLTITSYDNQRLALTTFDKPYGGYTSSNPPYIYDSGWYLSGAILTHTIENNAKSALIAWSMADNSNITSKGWLLNPSISVRKTNDEYILTDDLDEINNDGFYVDNSESLNIEKNRISNGVIQWAHRGYNEYAPENTMPSFEMAYKFGLRCMECDVRLTADNVPVILHDSTINRTARNLDGTSVSGTVEVANLILPKLRNNYDFGIWFSNEYAGTKIPTFEELIIWCKSKDCYLHIDLLGGAITTTAQLQILYDIVLSHNMQDKVLWEVNATSFIDWLQAKDANTEIIFNPSDILTTANIDTIVSYGLKKISTRVDTAYPVIEYANQKGLQVFLWSVNPLSVSNDNIMKYYKYGASGFYTSLQTVDEYLKDYEYVLSQRKDL